MKIVLEKLEKQSILPSPNKKKIYQHYSTLCQIHPRQHYLGFFLRLTDIFAFWNSLLSRKKRDIAITFVCVFVCLLAGFLINYWSDFDEIW